jgi:hypothetical protein
MRIVINIFLVNKMMSYCYRVYPVDDSRVLIILLCKPRPAPMSSLLRDRIVEHVDWTTCLTNM